jgi:DsbC/DsbD-like thiol-disulfide interchange protein
MRVARRGWNHRVRFMQLLAGVMLAALLGYAGDGAADRVRLIAERDAVTPGASFTLAVELQTQPGWHTYWLNPGDAGLPPTLRWRLPEGVRLSRLQFPTPARFEESGMVSFGYEDRVWLLADFEVGGGFTGEKLEIGLAANWMVCREACMQKKGEAQVALVVAAEAPAQTNATTVADFARWRDRLPKSVPGWTARAQSERKGLRLRIESPAESGPDAAAWARAQFYPLQRDAIELPAEQKWRRDGAGWEALLRSGPKPFKGGDVVEGVLVVPAATGGDTSTPRAWLVQATVEGK